MAFFTGCSANETGPKSSSSSRSSAKSVANNTTNAEALTQVTSAILAELRSTGGLRSIDAPQSSGIRLLADGSVYFFEDSSTKKLLTLSSSALENFKYLLSFAQGGQLYDQEPSTGTCSDMPIRSFFIYSGGNEIKIGENRDCHSYLISIPGVVFPGDPDNPPPLYAHQANGRIIQILEGFSSLYYLEHPSE